MCYGNERFIQYLASSNTNFQLSSFLDKSAVHGKCFMLWNNTYVKVRKFEKKIVVSLIFWPLIAVSVFPVF